MAKSKKNRYKSENPSRDMTAYFILDMEVLDMEDCYVTLTEYNKVKSFQDDQLLLVVWSLEFVIVICLKHVFW